MSSQSNLGSLVKSVAFWDYFNETARPKLAARMETFTKIFDYLDHVDRPVGIIETGCVRQKDNWAGDGGSTILFDKYAETHPGSIVYSVDIAAEATDLCRSLVSPRVSIHTGDSVLYLKQLAERVPPVMPFLDLLYLDSYDVDFDDTFPSAFHHIKELLAISPLLKPETLVVDDDSPPLFTGYIGNNSFQLLSQPKIGGKGRLIADYAEHLGVEPFFVGYQCAWTKLSGKS